MRILAIDTALGACAAAVYDSEAGSTAALESLAIRRGSSSWSSTALR
jgi:tRNA A37 threonylcarbamoyladenosine modification protein TsaB